MVRFRVNKCVGEREEFKFEYKKRERWGESGFNDREDFGGKDKIIGGGDIK